MGKKTKIDWADSTWSPVTGCRNGCPYCYAKRIADRFSGFDIMDKNNAPCEAWYAVRPDGIFEVVRPMTKVTGDGNHVHAPYPFEFNPTLHEYRLDDPMKWTESRNIFVCSMADLFGDWVPDSWIQRVFEACDKAPQHRYFFLTKNPARYIDLFNNGLVPKKHDNFWFGTTVTTAEHEFFFRTDANCFLSIEPIHSDFQVDLIPLKAYGIKWVIVGAETGNRVGKVKPEKEWVENIKTMCRINDVPIFMKESLQGLMGKDFVQEKP